MDSRCNNIVRVPAETSIEFFRRWFEFLKPYHHLTDREMDVAAAFLNERFKLSKMITDAALLDEISMNEATKRKVRESCDMTFAHFQVVMGKLKKVGVIKDNIINPRFIPNVREEDKVFKLMLLFDAPWNTQM